MTWRPTRCRGRRYLVPSGPVAGQRYGDIRVWSFFDYRPALLAHKLRDVIRAAPAFASGPRSLPTTERLSTRPRARRRARALIGVAHTRFDLVEEAFDLGRRARKDARREAVLRLVRFRDGFGESRDDANREERHEQLFEKERALDRQSSDRWRHEMPV